MPTHTATRQRIARTLRRTRAFVVWVLYTGMVGASLLAMSVATFVRAMLTTGHTCNIDLHRLDRVVLAVPTTGLAMACSVCRRCWTLALLILFHLLDQPLDPLTSSLVEEIVFAIGWAYGRVTIVWESKVLTQLPTTLNPSIFIHSGSHVGIPLLAQTVWILIASSLWPFHLKESSCLWVLQGCDIVWVFSAYNISARLVSSLPSRHVDSRVTDHRLDTRRVSCEVCHIVVTNFSGHHGLRVKAIFLCVDNPKFVPFSVRDLMSHTRLRWSKDLAELLWLVSLSGHHIRRDALFHLVRRGWHTLLRGTSTTCWLGIRTYEVFRIDWAASSWSALFSAHLGSWIERGSIFVPHTGCISRYGVLAVGFGYCERVTPLALWFVVPIVLFRAHCRLGLHWCERIAKSLTAELLRIVGRKLLLVHGNIIKARLLALPNHVGVIGVGLRCQVYILLFALGNIPLRCSFKLYWIHG